MAEESTRVTRGLMTREELLELDLERLQCELGNVGDWILDLADEMRQLLPEVERYHSLKAELSVAGQYKSLLQSVLRAIRDTV